MSWMAKLYETYERALASHIPENEKPMPISHTRQNAHINIVIDGDGNFKRAKVLFKNPVILPATEQSAGRTGKAPPPHPLGDKVHYIAKDYTDFGGHKPLFFDQYRMLLSSWCDSSYKHPKAVAILNYVDKARVVRDLIECGVFFSQDGRLITPSSIDEIESEVDPAIFRSIQKDAVTKKFDQGSALVCWSVEVEGEDNPDTWLDASLQESWTNYDGAQEGPEGLCYVTGEEKVLATNHPSKIFRAENGAKLISANDFEGYTFRGRFTDNKVSLKKVGPQSVGIGFETTQKAHNALRWLIDRQGKENGKQVTVAWAVSGKPIPEPLSPTSDFDLDDFGEVDASTVIPIETKTDISKDFGQRYSSALNRYMAGYRTKLKATESVVIMALDSATPGRMAVTYYRDFMAHDYLQKIEQWHREFAWYQRVVKQIEYEGKKSKSVTHWLISAPAPWNIVQAAYGDVIKSNELLKKNLYERLMPSIVEGKAIPIDLVNRAVSRASNRNNSEAWEWERNLGVACALYRGFCSRHSNRNNRRDYAMSLDTDYASRDYLYGRLLAVAERIEEMAMMIAGEAARSTHASRLMQRFADRPVSTWLNIEKALTPYQQRLRTKRPALEKAYKELLDDICDAFDVNGFSSEKRLSGEYLLGFHCQRKWLRDYRLSKGQWVPKSVDEIEATIEEGNHV